jgi:hypothetical protein
MTTNDSVGPEGQGNGAAERDNSPDGQKAEMALSTALLEVRLTSIIFYGGVCVDPLLSASHRIVGEGEDRVLGGKDRHRP